MSERILGTGDASHTPNEPQRDREGMLNGQREPRSDADSLIEYAIVELDQASQGYGACANPYDVNRRKRALANLRKLVAERLEQLEGARREAGECRSEAAGYHLKLIHAAGERILLAKLACRTPQFFNPLEAMGAEAIRDRVLKEIGLEVLP